VFAVVVCFVAGMARGQSAVVEADPGKVYLVEGECVEVPRAGCYIVRYQEYRIYIRTRDTSAVFVVGDRLRCPARLFPLRSPVDVHEFEHDRYLRQLDVDLRGVAAGEIEWLGHGHSFYSLCQRARAMLVRRLERVVPDPDARALLQAICLGDRSPVSPRVQELFKGSGTAHLLAVSGLHMGAIYLLLNFLLWMVFPSTRARAGCAIPLLWIFAGITGCSPPATRAATILSFILVGTLLGRRHQALNSLCASAFITLLVAPHLLYSVSFQMSYAAYAGIVLVLPLLQLKRRRARSRRGRFLQKVHALAVVSVAAQVGTLPLVAYYFHFINVNGVLINLLVVPLASWFLYAGVILLAVPVVVASFLAPVPVAMHDAIIFLLEQYRRVAIDWNDLYPTAIHVLFFHVIVLLVVVHARRRARVTARALVVAGFLFLGYHGVVLHQRGQREEVVVYDRHQRREVLLNFHGHYMFLARSDSSASLPPYVVANRLTPFPAGAGTLAEGVRFEGNRLETPRLTLYVADRQHREPGDADVVVITGGVYPDRLRGRIAPSTRVIVDRSNSLSCTRQWEEWGAREGIPVEKTGDLGPVIIPLSGVEG
jgi:competence protein ComEC